MRMRDLNDQMKARRKNFSVTNDYATFFGLSGDELERIAEVATDSDDFIRIWENEDWWRDRNISDL